MVAGDSGILVSRKLLGGRRDADVPPVGNGRSCLTMTPHFEMVVSGGKVADIERVGITLKLGRILHIIQPEMV